MSVTKSNSTISHAHYPAREQLYFHPLPGIALLLVLVFGSALDAQAAAPSVGMITRIENGGEVVSGGASTEALVGTVVHLNDELRTGPDGRLQVTFRDSTTLALGGNAAVVIERYVYDPDAGTGEAAIDATKGAIRFATGKLKTLSQKTITVTTPVAAVGVRGTEFWTGPLGQQHGVLLLQPSVTVTNQAGSVVLSVKGQGTEIASATSAPGPATFWSAAKIAQALETTDFQTPGQQQQQHQQPPQKGGQNFQPNPQYSLAKPLTIAGLFAAVPLVAFVEATQDDTNRPASP